MKITQAVKVTRCFGDANLYSVDKHMHVYFACTLLVKDITLSTHCWQINTDFKEMLFSKINAFLQENNALGKYKKETRTHQTLYLLSDRHHAAFARLDLLPDLQLIGLSCIALYEVRGIVD